MLRGRFLFLLRQFQDRLRRAARDSQTKIGEVAQRLVSTGRLPTEAS
jgi:hypothetical protein